MDTFDRKTLKKLSPAELDALCREIRRIITETVDENGGHLSSNLGSVELTVALHRVFSSPHDKIVWDVGHQCYTHKLLTGRAGRFSTLRQEGGISGFPRPDESLHDAFIAGHSSNSISAACGIARAMKLKGDRHSVIAVIGDGAFTGGMAYEGLNNAAKDLDNLIVVLNDNEMSISKNVGAVAKYLSSMRGRKNYINTKHSVEGFLDRLPVLGEPAINAITSSKDVMRWMLYHYTGYSASTMFENMGFVYLGPVDGHSIQDIEQYLEAAKAVRKPVLIHVVTKKGKGYAPAEDNPGEYHSVTPRAARESAGNPETCSEVFGKELAAIADSDSRICAITAAMKYGTGLNFFAAQHPERFFDVGIAEQHAVTFAAGLATQGMIPVFAVYSSFLQRSYDQLIHDAAICGTHIVLGIDRAGLIGSDGETHQGIFDVPMLTSIPNTTIYSPCTMESVKKALHTAIYDTKAIACLRYPRGGNDSGDMPCYDEDGLIHIRNGSSTLAVTYGRETAQVMGAVSEYDAKADILSPLKVFPIDEKILGICEKYDRIGIFEESYISGGFGEHLAAMLSQRGYKGTIHITAVTGIAKCAPVSSQLRLYGLDSASVADTLRGLS
ncbi:MAG: 1-deoxy-D-xylulose-5-phosphate synthase [Oscillospiraceae bacterium]|nr:1-deoxy-D-xylulose-5-phosphate synthase [Oscillospiraceae bacterium]